MAKLLLCELSKVKSVLDECFPIKLVHKVMSKSTPDKTVLMQPIGLQSTKYTSIKRTSARLTMVIKLGLIRLMPSKPKSASLVV